MTYNDLQRGNELTQEINEIKRNISILNNALHKREGNRVFDKFFFRCNEKNKVRIASYGIQFGGELKIDRECMDLIQNYFEKKLAEATAEFESIGKGGE